MRKYKSKRQIPRYDEYNRLLGEFTIRMIVNSVLIEKDRATPTGFYYYINDEGETVTIAPIKNTSFSRAEVETAELQLPDFTTNHFFDVIDQRTDQFCFIKWQMENGSSFGLMANEWEIDLE